MKKTYRLDILRIVTIYAFFSGLWIYLSDQVIGLLIRDTATIVRISVFKGFLFIILTSYLLYQLIARYILETKRAIQDFQKSEIRLNKAQEIAHLGSWELDVVSNILTWSDEVYRIFGLQPQEFGATYEAFLEAVHPDDRQAVDSAYSGSLREGRDTYEIEHRIVRRLTGEIRYVHEKCEHIRDETGRIIRSLGMVHDVTERKRAEDALRESEQRFQTLAEATYEGIVISENGRFLDVNDRYAEITGYERDELIGQNIAKILPPEEVERLVPNILLCKEIESENEILCKDGSRRIVEAHGKTIDQHGRQLRITAIRDITGRKLIELEREQYVRFFNNSSDLMCIAGTNGYFNKTNPAFSRVLGFTEEEFLAKPLVEFIYPDDRQPTQDEIARQINGNFFTFNFENRYLCKDGTFRVLSWNAIYMEDEQLIYGIARDVTEKKQAESRLVEAYQTLECKVRERTASLTLVNEQLTSEIDERKRIEQELLDHQRKLETMGLELSLAAEHERVRIAGELHDQVGQRLILSRIKIDALASRLPGSEHEQPIAELQQMIDQTLKDIRSLTFQLRPPILASAGLETAVQWLGEELKEHYGLIVKFAHDPLPLSLSYETRSAIFQAVRELLLNVAKHSGTNLAHISMTRADKTVKITVTDEGSGFDANKELMRNKKSGGFGIFNVQQRIDYLGGRFIIESIPGKGSRAIIVVPLPPGNEQE